MSLKKKAVIGLLVGLVAFGGYKVYESTKDKNVIEKEHKVEQKKEVATSSVSNTKTREVEATQKKTQKKVSTVVKEFEPQSGKLIKETTTVEAIIEDEDKVATAATTSIQIARDNTVHSTTVENSSKVEDKGKESISNQKNQYLSGIKIIAVLPTPDLGVAKEILRTPDVIPMIGGTAANVYLTVVNPTVGLGISKPTPLPHVEAFVGLGLDVMETNVLNNKFVLRGAAGVSLNLSF